MSSDVIKTRFDWVSLRRGAYIFKNPILLFTICRYFIYTLLFARGILAAKVLGPELYGIWGFLFLVQTYSTYVSVGAHYAINVQLATESEATAEEKMKNIGIALVLTSCVACGLIAAGSLVQGLALPVFEKYRFHQYAFFLSVFAGLSQVQLVFTNVYRVYGKLFRIALVEMIGAIAPLATVLVFRREALVKALLISMVLAAVVSLVVFLIKAPFAFRFSWDVKASKALLALGIPLIIYNVSFYFITVVAQTIISIFYPIETMGYYSLASSITYAVLLGVNSVSWVVFPNILFRTRHGLDEHVVARTVQKVNDLFGTAVFVMVFAVMLGLPVLFFVLPRFEPVKGTLSILLLSQAVFSLCVGYNCLAIARNEQIAVAKISLVSVAVVLGVSLGVAFLHLPYIWVSISVLVGAIVFTIQQSKMAARLINLKVYSFGHHASILPLGSILAVVSCVAGNLLGHTYVGALTGATIYAITNYAKLKLVWYFGLNRVLRMSAAENAILLKLNASE